MVIVFWDWEEEEGDDNPVLIVELDDEEEEEMSERRFEMIMMIDVHIACDNPKNGADGKLHSVRIYLLTKVKLNEQDIYAIAAWDFSTRLKIWCDDDDDDEEAEPEEEEEELEFWLFVFDKVLILEP